VSQEHNHFRLNRYTSGILVFLFVATVSAIVAIQPSRTDTKPAITPAVGAAAPSQFSFSGTPNWWQGATSKSDMALFHTIRDSCFISVQHKTGTVDAAAELQKSSASLTSQGYTLTPGSTQTLTLQTNTGPKQYELQQSSVTTPVGASKVLGGKELGYLQLSNGYIMIMGNCETAEQLSATIPALQAIKFDATN